MKFWGVKSLVGFRYGKAHHAIVGGFVVHVPDETAPGACLKAFADWAQPYADAFEVEIAHDAPAAFPWNGKIVDVDSLVATTATLGDHDQYAAVYATYPVWPKALPDPRHRRPGARRARTRQGGARLVRRRGPAQGAGHEHHRAEGDVLTAGPPGWEREGAPAPST